MKIFFAVFLILQSYFLFAQDITISGNVKNQKTGEKLSGAEIFTDNKKLATTSNSYGFYSFSIPQKQQKVFISNFGYQTISLVLFLKKDTLLNIELLPLENTIDEVTIRAKKESYSDQRGNFIVPIDVVKNAPALLGEADILKTIQLLPGVQQGTEGTAGLHIRGGSPDQTLILIDGVPVYNAYHLFGFFSVFNPDAVSDIRLFKNELPAQYGGRLSAVVDLLMREGNKKKRSGSFSISPIAGKLTLEGPIKKDKASYLFSIRKTWIDILAYPLQKLSRDQLLAYGFYDLNAKFNYEINPQNHLYLSFYAGKDSYSNNNGTSKFGYSWGNFTSILRWNRIFSPKLFKNTTLSFTNYNYSIKNSFQDKDNIFSSTVSSKIQDIGLKTDFDFIHSPNHITNFGLSVTSHQFKPEISQTTGIAVPNEISPTPSTFVADGQAYIQHDWDITQKLKWRIGLHYNSILVNSRFYHSLQPRLSLTYEFSDDWLVRAAYFKTNQYLHLLSNSSLGLPTDLWVPVTDNIPPERANSFSIGLSKKIRDWHFSVDAYSKSMYNLIEYKEGASFLNDLSAKWYDKVAIGQGNSKGFEFFAQRSKGKIQGFVSYTLSWTNRLFEELNQGKEFPYKYDRRHSLSTNFMYKFSENKQFSLTFSLLSGSLTSLPTSKYVAQRPPAFEAIDKNNGYYYYFNQLGDLPYRNNFRLPIFHRLDLNYKTTKTTEKGQRSWVFSVYNTYNRQNPFFVYIKDNQLVQTSLFPIIPSIGYERKF